MKEVLNDKVCWFKSTKPPRNKSQILAHEAIIHMREGTNRFLENIACTQNKDGEYVVITKNGDIQYFHDYTTPSSLIPTIPKPKKQETGNKLSVKI